MRHRTRRAPLVVAGSTLALVIALAACGSDGKTTNGGPDAATVAAIRHSITVGFTSRDPAICVQNATPNLIENLYGGSLGKCRREAQKGKSAKSVAISEISVSGDTAHARVAPHGGTNAGEEFRLTLSRIGPDWKLDDLRYIYGSDPDTDRQLDLVLRALPGGLGHLYGERATRCVETRLRRAFRSAGVPFAGQELKTESKAVLVGCMRSDPSLAAVYRRSFLRHLDAQAWKEIGGTGARCIVAGLRRAISNEDMVELLASKGRPTALLRKVEAIGRHCGSEEAIVKSFDNFSKT